MDFTRLTASWGSIGLVVVAAVGAYLVVVLYTRLSGPRSLATMSSFDFAATIAIGSTVATAANLSTPLAQAVTTLTVLYLAQVAAGLLRRKRVFGTALDNSPIILVHQGRVLDDNLDEARVSRRELWSQLRQAGVHHRSQVAAAILETSGTVSVITGDEDLDDDLLEGVRGLP
jgi:uncharacterized membrane protein YcaP (DUF421 family)